MQIDDFKSNVSTFADPGTEILFERNRLVVQVNGDLIEQSILSRAGDIFVIDNGAEIPASLWILRRLARLPLLASRLLETIPKNDFFIPPRGNLLTSLEVRPQDAPSEIENAVASTMVAIDERSPMETTVLYITSDAGEGKTSVIYELTRQQAERFLAGKSDWLMVPIPLGGRHFLRFDDITVGALQNRYRFPFLYYNSFLALARMGVIVPAFDGFEEMFVENSSGEALSAMGLLLGTLNSKGAMIIAARKAYFEFENIKAQARLYDTIRTYSVGFGKLELKRWNKGQFLEYCQKRNVAESTKIYDRVSERLTAEHSLLTRAVLVKRLVDIAAESPSLEDFLSKIHASGTDFFSVFVRSIIDREANEKWIDRSGEIGSPLLSVEEHCELLSQIAHSMWESRVDYLKRENLEFVADYFCETKKKSSHQAQQIRERVRGHALLIPSPNAHNAVEFDHEEFRLFFLGEAIADQLRPLNDRAKADILNSFRKGVLPRHAQHAFARAVKRDPNIHRLTAAEFLLGIAGLDGQASFTQDNCSSLIIRLISAVPNSGLVISNLAFGADALRDRDLANLTFEKCYFSPTSLENTRIASSSFSECTFSELRLYDSTKFESVAVSKCRIDALRLVDRDLETWEPDVIRFHLEQSNVKFADAEAAVKLQKETLQSSSPELNDLEKLIRYFMRSTHISESVVRMKLGPRGTNFIDNVAPELIAHGVLVEIGNRGSDHQQRFKLGASLDIINTAMANASGSFTTFLTNIRA